MENNPPIQGIQLFAIANAAQPVVSEDEPNVLSFPKGWVVADSNPMRDGTIQDVASMNIAKFKTNPVLLKDHNWSVDGIIGNVLDIRKEDDGTVRIYKVQMAQTADAQQVKQLILDRMVRDTSTGLLVGKYEENDSGALVYKNSELVEISVVMVGNNYAARLNQFNHNTVEPNENPTPPVEQPVATPPAAPAEPVAPATPATPAEPVAPAADQAEEVNALKAKVAQLEAAQTNAVRETPITTPKQNSVEPKLSSANILHGQVVAIKNGDRAKLAELNTVARETHAERVAGLSETAKRNALDFGDTALVPSAELLAEVRKPSTNFGKLLPYVHVIESLMKQAVTYTTSPGYVDFVDDASFCADANAADPTYALKTLTLVRKSAATVICRDLDTVSPIALEQDVTAQLRNGALKVQDAVIIAALLAIGSPATTTIDDSTSATTLFTGLGQMPGAVPATYLGDGSNMVYITTWGNFQYMKAQAALLTNAALSMELAQGTLNGFPVVVIPNGLLPSVAGTTTADDNWIIFGDLSGVTLGRWENMVELDVRTDGTVGGVNLTASNSVALIGRMHIAATVDFNNFVFAR